MQKTSRLRLCVALALILATVACTFDQVLSNIDLLLQTSAAILPAVGDVSAGDAAFIQKLSGIGSAGITVVQKDYDDYVVSGAVSDLDKVTAAVAAVQKNLNDELAAGHIENPAARAKVTAWVNLVAVTLKAVLNALPKVKQASTADAKKAAIAEIPDAPSLQAKWRSEVCGGDAKCGKLVKAKQVKSKSHRHHWGLGEALGEAFGNR